MNDKTFSKQVRFQATSLLKGKQRKKLIKNSKRKQENY